MNTKQLMIYILSVVATLACSLFAGWSVRDNCGEWLSLTLLIGAGVALLMQLYFLIKAVRARHLWRRLSLLCLLHCRLLWALHCLYYLYLLVVAHEDQC